MKHNTYTTRSLWAIALLSVIVTSAQAAQVGATLSQSKGWVGVPVYLSVSIRNASSHTAPTCPAIDGMTIRSAGAPSRSLRTMSINGRVTRNESVTYAFAITPTREGDFTIPALNVKADGQTYRTQPFAFSAQTSEVGDLLFVEIVGAKTRVRVGEQLPLTLRIYIKPYVDKQLGVTLPPDSMWSLVDMQNSRWGWFQKSLEQFATKMQPPKGSLVRHVDPNDPDQKETTYYRYDIPASIYPDRAGKLEASDVYVLLRYPTGLKRSRGFLSRGRLTLTGARPVVQVAKTNGIEILPLPKEGRPAEFRGAIGHYTISAAAAPTYVAVGEPITLTLTVRGRGRLAELPAPPLAELPALTRHFKLSDEPLAGVVIGDVKHFTTTLRPRETTTTEIPAIPLAFFNPTTNRYETAATTPIALHVRPAETMSLAQVVSAAGPMENAAATPETPGPKDLEAVALYRPFAPRGHWLFAGVLVPPALALSLLLTTSLWRYRRDHPVARARRAASHHRRNLAEAADAETVRQSLLTFAADAGGRGDNPLSRSEAIQTVATLSPQREPGQASVSDEYDTLLSRCEQARFSPANANPPALASDARAWLNRFAQHAIAPDATERSDA